MKTAIFVFLLLATGAVYAQPSQCEQGATLTLELEQARTRFTPQHPEVMALEAQIQKLHEELLAANPDKSIDEICAVPAVASTADEGLICRREQRTGTHRRVRVCTTRAQREERRRDAQEIVRDINTGTTFDPPE